MRQDRLCPVVARGVTYIRRIDGSSLTRPCFGIPHFVRPRWGRGRFHVVANFKTCGCGLNEFDSQPVPRVMLETPTLIPENDWCRVFRGR